MVDIAPLERRPALGAKKVIDLVRDRPWPVVVWAAMIAWSASLFAIVRSRFLEFRYTRFDLGNMVQAVWNTADGRTLETTFGTGEQLPRLASHVDPILVLLTPLWLLVPSPLTLAAAQIGACALGALPVLWLARRHLESETAAGFLALAYLAYPSLAWTAVDPMHPLVLAIPLFLCAIWFLDSERILPFTLFALLAAATGELMGLPIACLGLWYWRTRGHRRAGIAIACAGVAWTLICIKVLIPAFWGGDSQFYSYFEAVGGSPEGVLRVALTHPAVIGEALITRDDLLSLLALTVPLCGAFVLAPGLAVAALPQLTAISLSSLGAHTDPRAHAVAGVIPFLIAASVVGIGTLPRPRRVRLAAAVLAMCVVTSVMFGPWPGVPGPRVPSLHGWPYGTPTAAHIEALRAAVVLVPDDAAVASTNHAGSHLSARRYFFSVPRLRNSEMAADWVVIDTLDPWMPLRPANGTSWGTLSPIRLEMLKRRIERSGNWQLVFARSDVYVFRRESAA